ncbi:hypothetical protein ABK040_009283 [Willaertia magna]
MKGLIKEIVAQWGGGLVQKAKALFKLVKEIYEKGMFANCLLNCFADMPTEDRLKNILLVLAQIGAWVATGGLYFVAMVVLSVSDAIQMWDDIRACLPVLGITFLVEQLPGVSEAVLSDSHLLTIVIDNKSSVEASVLFYDDFDSDEANEGHVWLVSRLMYSFVKDDIDSDYFYLPSKTVTGMFHSKKSWSTEGSKGSITLQVGDNIVVLGWCTGYHGSTKRCGVLINENVEENGKLWKYEYKKEVTYSDSKNGLTVTCEFGDSDQGENVFTITN